MHILKNQLFTILFIYLIFFCRVVIAVDFFGSDDDENLIWGTGVNQFVKYAKQDTEKYGVNDHPVNLDSIEVHNALELLEYEDEGFLGLTEDLKSVFTVRQTKVLGEQLANGLKNANPEQDIIFVLQKAESKFLGLNERSFLAGRAFYKDNRLNIIIGDYDHFRSDAFEKVYDPSGQRQIPYDFNFGSRSISTKAFEGSAMIDIPGIENKQIDKFRYDWFVIDVKLASDAYLAKTSGKKKTNETYDSKALELEAAKMAKQRREMRAEMARMRKEMQDLSANDSPSTKTIEERIATLDQLLDKKLISQEEYDSKREAILNDI